MFISSPAFGLTGLVPTSRSSTNKTPLETNGQFYLLEGKHDMCRFRKLLDVAVIPRSTCFLIVQSTRKSELPAHNCL